MTKEKHVFLKDDGFLSGCKDFFVVDFDNGKLCETGNIWFSSPAYASVLRDRFLDSVAIALIFLSMLQRRKLVLHGTVSGELAQNLEEFQRAWARWRPDRYSVVDVVADEWATSSVQTSQEAISAFSGGVDGTFTAWRHLSKSPGQHHKNISAAVLINGLDIPLDAEEASSTAEKNCKAMFDGLPCRLVSLRTNLKTFLPDWEMNFGAAVAACLHTFAGSYGYGLMGSDEAYDQLVIPWGSNPITTPLLSSSRFRVLYDGTGFTRTERCLHIGNWPNAMKYLRVCWEGPQTGRNCCKCEKCIRTILNFRAAGLPRPSAFEQDVTDDQIRSMHIRNKIQAELMKEIYQTALNKGIQGTWVDAVKDRINVFYSSAR